MVTVLLFSSLFIVSEAAPVGYAIERRRELWNMRRVEILAPAGSIEGLYGALKMGADAVYVGTKRFGARAFADNPSVEELIQALHYVHLRGKKIYLTVNTLLTDRELEEDLYPLILPLYEEGLDACIVQDLGVLKFLHECFPDMDLHASTQMTLFSGEEADLLKPYGVTRYVPARELTIQEIREAGKKTDLEIEVFVHGALCYCYSGQCLMSQVIGGRSGNRGMCAQPCRLSFQTPYGEGHFFSTKDICTLMHIPELVEAGIDSFKIEGRMKRKEYSMYLSFLYRKYVEIFQTKGNSFFSDLVKDRKSELWRDYRRSMDLYNRGGFSESFLFEQDKRTLIDFRRNGHYGVLVGEVVKADRDRAEFIARENLHYQDILEFRDQDGRPAYEYTLGKDEVAGTCVRAKVMRGSHIYPGQNVYRTRNAALLAWIHKRCDSMEDTLGLKGMFVAETGQKMKFTVEGYGTRITVYGDVVQPAAKRPVQREDIIRRLDQLGNTAYHWEDLVVDAGPDIFVPVGGLKELRRRAIAEWEQRTLPRRKANIRPETVIQSVENETEGQVCDPLNIISVAELHQLDAAVNYAGPDTIFHLKLEDLPSGDWKEAAELLRGRKLALSFPRILRGRGKEIFDHEWKTEGNVFSGNMVSFVIVNSFAMILYAARLFPDAVRIADTNLYRENRMAESVYHEFGIRPPVPVIYGRIPVMVTESCLARNLSLCGSGEKRIPVTAPKGDKFVVVNHCKYCYNTIYTEQPAVTGTGQTSGRLDFTWEEEDEVRKGIAEWNF